MNTTHRGLATRKQFHLDLLSVFRSAAILFCFSLLLSFSGSAMSESAVHKCMQADGYYEYTDTKCESVPPAPGAATKPAGAASSTPAIQTPEPARMPKQLDPSSKLPDANTGSTNTH